MGVGEESTAPVTISDVARAAGVAPSTVSRAFSRPGRVSVKTSERIFQAARKLGYRQDEVPRVSTSRTYHLVAVCVADVMNPVFGATVKGIFAGARKRGYMVVLIDSNESSEIESETTKRSLATVDGFIFVGSRMSDAGLRHLAGIKPVMTVNRKVPGVSSVAPASDEGLGDALTHLVSEGRSTVTYLAGPTASWQSGVRWRSLLERARRDGKVTVHQLACPTPTIRGGIEAFDMWRAHPTSAVIAYNDLIAIGFMRRAMACGLRIPNGVAVIGFDDIPFSALVSPALSTVRVNQFQMGVVAVNRLLDMVEKPSHHERQAPSEDVVPVSFMVRESG